MAEKGNIWFNSAHVTVGLKTPTKENIAMKMIYPPLQLQLLQNSKKFSVLLPLAFALRVFGMVVLPAILCSCLGDGGPEYTKISVGWAPGYAYVPTCKTLVKYQATGIEIQGVSIPVPQLGGAAQIGGVKVDPTLLNRAYHTTQTLDTSYHNSCALLPSFTTEKAKFENAVQNMQDSQTKLQQLAMSFSNIEEAAPSQPAATGSSKPAATEEAKPAASPAKTAAAKPATSPSPVPAVKAQKVKHRLANWVASYSKRTTAATVKTHAKPNTALGLPPAAPTPTPPTP